jgi:DNA-binding transcriptional ArsR family regulator
MDNQPSPISPLLEKTENDCRAKIFAALSDPTRLRIVELLVNQHELSGSEIAQQLNISLALFCHHSKTLAEAGLITTRRDGQTKYNALNRDVLTTCLKSFPGLID